ncbi:hypothetical protein [Streptomyces axinellae]
MDYKAGEEVGRSLYEAARKGEPIDPEVMGVLTNEGGLGNCLAFTDSGFTLKENTPGLARLEDYVFARELIRHHEREGAYGYRPPNNSEVGQLLHQATRGGSLGPQTAAAATRGGLGEYVRRSNGRITLAANTPGQEEYADYLRAQDFRDYYASGYPRGYLPHPRTSIGKYIAEGGPLGAKMVEVLKEYEFGKYLIPSMQGQTHLSKEAPKYTDYRAAVFADEVKAFFRSERRNAELRRTEYRVRLPGGDADPGKTLHEMAVAEAPLLKPVVEALRESGFDDHLHSDGHGIYLSKNAPGVAEEQRRRELVVQHRRESQGLVEQSQSLRGSDVRTMQPPAWGQRAVGAVQPPPTWGQGAGPYVPTSATRALMQYQSNQGRGQGQPPNQRQQRGRR